MSLADQQRAFVRALLASSPSVARAEARPVLGAPQDAGLDIHRRNIATGFAERALAVVPSWVDVIGTENVRYFSREFLRHHPRDASAPDWRARFDAYLRNTPLLADVVSPLPVDAAE